MPAIPRTSKDGVQRVKVRESRGGHPDLKAYLDGGGVPTLGYGHTRGVALGDVCTVEQADAWIAEDIRIAEETLLKHLPLQVVGALAQPCFDALVSFTYNLGNAAWKNADGTRTGIWHTIVAARWLDVANQLRRWVYDNGVKVEGLVNRRESEIAQWKEGMK